MRKVQAKGGALAAVLDREDDAVSRPADTIPFRRSASDPVHPRRELVDDYADDADTEAFLRASGRNRRIRRGLIPRTRNGWIAAGVGLVVTLGAIGAGCMLAVRYATTSDTFRIPSSQSIELDGNSHISRAQMLSVFGEDVDRNIFRLPLADRRAQLEQMPWVEHATVMRLLPNRLRVHITERVPVAYLRQGGSIGLVDANGVLLDIPPDVPGNGNYAFPVITGMKASDDPASRQSRMKLYAAFLKDLDSDGRGTSAKLSEVDLSDPEDVKVLLPDNNQDVMVHFGTQNFLKRYNKFQEHIAEWRTTYPRLSSVDMRYERQVVLQMPPKDSTVAAASPTAGVETAAAKPAAESARPAVTVASAPSPKATVTAPAPVSAQNAKNAPQPPKHTVYAVAKPVKGTAKDTKDAATRKRVDAIKAWMAKRQQARAAAAAPDNR